MKRQRQNGTNIVYTKWDLLGFTLTVLGILVLFIGLWAFLYSVWMLTVVEVFA